MNEQDFIRDGAYLNSNKNKVQRKQKIMEDIW